jgi:hypothetical protein
MMEIDTVRKLLVAVSLEHPKPGDSKELQALRSISTALLHIAEGIAEVQRTQAAMITQGR